MGGHDPITINSVTIFPELFETLLATSIPGRAAKAGLVRYRVVDPFETNQEPTAIRTTRLDSQRRCVGGQIAVCVAQVQIHPGSERALGVVGKRPDEDLALGAVGLVEVPHDQMLRCVGLTHDGARRKLLRLLFLRLDSRFLFRGGRLLHGWFLLGGRFLFFRDLRFRLGLFFDSLDLGLSR